jgi:hypothetical protein
LKGHAKSIFALATKAPSPPVSKTKPTVEIETRR